ncbi:hypothetical protein BU15DRAFT_69569 [Melanogaster broomeanus]|nr:hypothetical protein BU15DRAFT_69569 [Melanogaster broomeanus]
MGVNKRSWAGEVSHGNGTTACCSLQHYSNLTGYKNDTIVGRMLSRFGKDIETFDNSGTLSSVTFSLVTFAAAIITIEYLDISVLFSNLIRPANTRDSESCWRISLRDFHITADLILSLVKALMRGNAPRGNWAIDIDNQFIAMKGFFADSPSTSVPSSQGLRLRVEGWNIFVSVPSGCQDFAY